METELISEVSLVNGNFMHKINHLSLVVVLAVTLLNPASAQHSNSGAAKNYTYLSARRASISCSMENRSRLSPAICITRVPRDYWRDRMRKMKAMGLSTLTTYIFWNLHEPRPGQFDFSGWLKKGRNEITVLDLEPHGNRSVQGIKDLVFESP
jgi:hypothetical protein